MPTIESIAAGCPNCKKDKFELRLFKDEGIGVAKCLNCERNHLLLDSGDYWFDVIQRGYPRVSRCTCKSTSFQVHFNYSFRDCGDVEHIELCSTCSSCRKTKRQMNLDIDYSPTRHLVTTPLVFCKNPCILYDLKDLSLYATPADIARVTRFLRADGACHFAGRLRRDAGWSSLQQLGGDEVEPLIQSDDFVTSRYLMIYASPNPISVEPVAIETSKKEDAFWKREEIIRISSPTKMILGPINSVSHRGLLYYIKFANEYVRKERAVPKSGKFLKLTGQLLAWLEKEFVNWRGPLCFDNPSENVRLFGDEFRSRTKQRRKK